MHRSPCNKALHWTAITLHFITACDAERYALNWARLPAVRRPADSHRRKSRKRRYAAYYVDFLDNQVRLFRRAGICFSQKGSILGWVWYSDIIKVVRNIAPYVPILL